MRTHFWFKAYLLGAWFKVPVNHTWLKAVFTDVFFLPPGGSRQATVETSTLVISFWAAKAHQNSRIHCSVTHLAVLHQCSGVHTCACVFVSYPSSPRKVT